MKSSSIQGILSRMVFLPVFILAVFVPRSLSEGEAFVYRSTAMPATIQPLYLPLLVNIIGLPATAAPTATPTATSAPSWTERTAPLSPSPRDNMEMVYDSSRDVVMLFGGDDGTQLLSDTWEWDGTTWTEKTPATQPTSRYFFSMAYDSQRQVTVLFGGKRGDGTALSDTWEWDGTNWTKKTPMTSPSSRWGTLWHMIV